VALGLANVLRGPAAMAVISIAGSAVLCWMGLAMVRSAPKATLGAAPAKARMLNPITAGIIVSLSNPYWTLWWATVGLAFLFKWPEAGRLGIVAFAVGHVLSDLAWYSFVSAGVARGRKLMPLKLYRFVLGLCGVALVGFAAWFAWHGGVQAGTVLQ
jgi:threonine/homoserine/homoserine lactone efflux protein